jgi:hypothetical protein
MSLPQAIGSISLPLRQTHASSHTDTHIGRSIKAEYPNLLSTIYINYRIIKAEMDES